VKWYVKRWKKTGQKREKEKPRRRAKLMKKFNQII